MCLVLKQTTDVVVALASAAKVNVLSCGGFLCLQGVNERFHDLQMEALCSAEALHFKQSAQHTIPEEWIFRIPKHAP